MLVLALPYLAWKIYYFYMQVQVMMNVANMISAVSSVAINLHNDNQLIYRQGWPRFIHVQMTEYLHNYIMHQTTNQMNNHNRLTLVEFLTARPIQTNCARHIVCDICMLQIQPDEPYVDHNEDNSVHLMCWGREAASRNLEWHTFFTEIETHTEFVANDVLYYNHEPSQCAVCLEPIIQTTDVKMKICGCANSHVFHAQCLFVSIAWSFRCPMCRRNPLESSGITI